MASKKEKYNLTISFSDKFFFTRHLAVMLESGVPIGEAVDTLIDQAKTPAFKKVLEVVNKDISNGSNLNVTLQKFPKIFDALYINMIQVGEESGNLENNLKYLAYQLKKSNDFKQKITSASIYPALILVTTILVGGGVSYFVLPKLIELFSSLDVTLPITTKVLLWIAVTMRDHGVSIFSSFFGFIICVSLLIQIHQIKYYWDKFLLNLPIIGIFLRYVQLSTFCRNVGTMVKSGIPIVKAMNTQLNSTDNLIYKELSLKIIYGIESGRHISDVLNQIRSKYFPKIVEKMISVGEKTGRLDETLLYLADYFEEEVDTASKNFSSILEPVLLLVIGGIVAFVALSIITPIYQFTGSIRK